MKNPHPFRIAAALFAAFAGQSAQAAPAARHDVAATVDRLGHWHACVGAGQGCLALDDTFHGHLFTTPGPQLQLHGFDDHGAAHFIRPAHRWHLPAHGFSYGDGPLNPYRTPRIASPAPEPSTVALWAIGVIALMGTMRRRKR